MATAAIEPTRGAGVRRRVRGHARGRRGRLRRRAGRGRVHGRRRHGRARRRALRGGRRRARRHRAGGDSSPGELLGDGVVSTSRRTRSSTPGRTTASTSSSDARESAAASSTSTRTARRAWRRARRGRPGRRPARRLLHQRRRQPDERPSRLPRAPRGLRRHGTNPLVDSIAESLAADGSLTEEQAECLAQGVVDEIGTIAWASCSPPATSTTSSRGAGRGHGRAAAGGRRLRRAAERVRLSGRRRSAGGPPPPDRRRPGARRRRWSSSRVVVALLVRQPVVGRRARRRRRPRPPSTTPTTTTEPVDGEPGAPGVGDPYYPGLGNGGFDVEHYTLDLTWLADEGALEGVDHDRGDRDPGPEPVQPRPLRARGPVGDRRRRAGRGRRATDRELVIDPADGHRRGRRLHDRRHLRRAARCRSARAPTSSTSAGRPTAGRPSWCRSRRARQTFFPVNDHPTDKATYTIRVTAPEDQTVAANGLLVARERHRARHPLVDLRGVRSDGQLPRADRHRRLRAGRRRRGRRTSRSATPSTGRWPTRRPSAVERHRRDDHAARRRLRAVPVRGLRRARRRRGRSASRSRRRRSRSSAPTSRGGPGRRPDPRCTSWPTSGWATR